MKRFIKYFAVMLTALFILLSVSCKSIADPLKQSEEEAIEEETVVVEMKPEVDKIEDLIACIGGEETVRALFYLFVAKKVGKFVFVISYLSKYSNKEKFIILANFYRLTSNFKNFIRYEIKNIRLI